MCIRDRDGGANKVEFFWVLLFGGALLLGYASQKQNQQANEEVVADEIVDLPHDDLVTTNDVPARRQRKTEEEHIRDYVNELIQYENLKDTDKVRYKRKFLNSDVYKLGDELPSDIEKIETPVGVTLVKPVLNSTKMFRGLLEPVELNVSGGFEDICHSPQFAQWLTLLFELFDGDVVGRIDYLTKTLSIICLLYTSDAADEEDSVDLCGRRIIKKKTIMKLSLIHILQT